ncbi:PTS sugar transporter subunit IIA [Bacillus luti]|nr:PTS ascorbate transporter subunit IIA [Bacillus cereus]
MHEVFNTTMIHTADAVTSWEEAIRLSAKPLIKADKIENRYIDKMIENVYIMGPYIVIAPGLAFAHARPEDGVKSLGLSMLRLQNPVKFSEMAHHEVQIVLTLAAPDQNGHLELLSKLSQVFSEENAIQKILTSSEEEVVKFIKGE